MIFDPAQVAFRRNQVARPTTARVAYWADWFPSFFDLRGLLDRGRHKSVHYQNVSLRLLVDSLNLLGRSLHHIVADRALNSILIGIVVNSR